MPRVSIYLETAALERYGLPIITIADYDIQRELSAAGTFALSFPADEDLAQSIRTRHRVTVVEEGRTRRLLTRGIITDRQFDIKVSNAGTLRIAGFTRLYGLAAQSTHLGKAYNGTVNIKTIAEDLTGETVDVTFLPNYADLKPKVTFDDTSKLDALLTALKYCRVSIRESLDNDEYELVPWDAVPDSGYRLVTVDQAGPELDRAAAGGIAIMAGTPSIGYNGRELATRIIPLGTDFNGDPLTLQYATATGPYAIQSAVSPGGAIYWYLEDAAATENAELIEMQLEQSEIKVNNDDQATRVICANALYAVACQVLLQRKSDALAFTGVVANGAGVDAIPGSRFRVQYKGVAHGFNGEDDYWRLDKHMLITKRRDSAQGNGVRGVSFTLNAPEQALRIPSIPEAVPIPPPPTDPPEPPWPNDEMFDPLDEVSPDAFEDEPLPGMEDFKIPMVPMPPTMNSPKYGSGPYPKCCADQTTNTEDTPPVPPDIEDGPDPFLANRCRVPWEAVAVQDFRFVNKWGGIWANPGIGFGAFLPGRDVGLVVLVSSSGDPVLNVQGAQANLLLQWDGNTPANFGGDGHTWYRLYSLEIIDEIVDFTGTTGVTRNVTWMRASEEFGSVDIAAVTDFEYAAAPFNAVAHLDLQQNSLRDDLVWMWFDEVYRSFDTMDFRKVFHHETRSIHDHDYTLHNAEFVTFTPGGGAGSATSWMIQDDKPNGFVHGIFATYEAEATADPGVFPLSCRVFAIGATVRLRAQCRSFLIVP